MDKEDQLEDFYLAAMFIKTHEDFENMLLAGEKAGVLTKIEHDPNWQETEEVFQKVLDRNGSKPQRVFLYEQEFINAFPRFGSSFLTKPRFFDDLILVNKGRAETLKKAGLSSKNIAHLLVHEVAHNYTTPQEGEFTANKSNEYLTDRVANAMIGDDKSYLEACEKLFAVSQNINNQYIEKSRNDLANGQIKKEQFESIMERIKGNEARRDRIYGSHTERLANIKYDIDRRQHGK